MGRTIVVHRTTAADYRCFVRTMGIRPIRTHGPPCDLFVEFPLGEYIQFLAPSRADDVAVQPARPFAVIVISNSDEALDQFVRTCCAVEDLVETEAFIAPAGAIVAAIAAGVDWLRAAVLK